jgi:hypothetical protein
VRRREVLAGRGQELGLHLGQRPFEGDTGCFHVAAAPKLTDERGDIDVSDGSQAGLDPSL